jgi:translocator protein
MQAFFQFTQAYSVFQSTFEFPHDRQGSRLMSSISQPSKSPTRIALITVPSVLGLGFLAGQLSNSGFGNVWFDELAKPSAMPPGWAFGTAWSILYVLLGIVLAIFLAAPPSKARSAALALFLTQLLLNFCWSPIFIGAHQVELGLATIVVIFLLSVAVMRPLIELSRGAAGLMIPYLAWLSFAAYLNLEIWRLNPAA